MISAPEALGLVQLAPDEERALAKLEAAVDAQVHAGFTGAPMRLELQQPVDLKVGYALQRKYERGGWRAGFSPYNPDTKCCVFQLAPLFMPTLTLTPPPIKNTKLPAVVKDGPLALSRGGWRLLVRMPTRGRPAQALEVLAQFRARAGMPFLLEVVIDEDDASMHQPEVLQRLVALGCTITSGHHASKVAAVNAGRIQDWDVLLLASDDMIPVVDNYAVRALGAMESHFPHLDGLVYFDDGYQHAKCCTLPIMGRRLYDRFGYVYHPDYRSLWCDTEQTEVLTRLGRIAYVDEIIIEHRHHVVTGAKPDALYQRNDALWQEDKKTFDNRRRADFDLWPVVFSVCIAALPARRTQLDRLYAHLWQQMLAHPRLGNVEIVVDSRPPPLTIGEKRQTLLERARGQYVAFVDDDDWVSHDYVERILAALTEGDPDCASMVGVMTTAGAVPERFENSLRYTEWRTVAGLHERTPTHLSPVRRSLALKAGFPSKNHAEDFDYSRRLYPLLKHEASTGTQPLYYYFFWPGKEPGT